MKIATKNRFEEKRYNYKILDIAKYAAAIMVICIHCNQLFPQEYLNFFIKNIICRIAVPFFFISSAYFVRKGSRTKEGYVKEYLKKLMISYCLWSLVFIPIGLDWIHQNLSLAGYLLPFALLYGLIHIGTYYHLWYVPAAILTIFLVDKLLKKFSYKNLFVLATLLFAFGSIESYYGLLQNGWLKDFFDLLYAIIFTTRSGLLYGMIFTLIGFYIFDNQEKLQSLRRYAPICTIVCAILLIMEGSFLYTIVRLDMNFLLMLVPFSFFLFISLLFFPYTPKCETRKFRDLSKYYYFVHPVCIVIIEEIGTAFHIDILSSGLLSLLLVILLTHSLSSMIIGMKGVLQTSCILSSALFGVIATCIVSGLFFLVKPADIVIKFEFVPCLWFYFSFMMYSVMLKVYNKKHLSCDQVSSV